MAARIIEFLVEKSIAFLVPGAVIAFATVASRLQESNLIEENEIVDKPEFLNFGEEINLDN